MVPDQTKRKKEGNELESREKKQKILEIWFTFIQPENAPLQAMKVIRVALINKHASLYVLLD